MWSLEHVHEPRWQSEGQDHTRRSLLVQWPNWTLDDVSLAEMHFKLCLCLHIPIFKSKFPSDIIWGLAGHVLLIPTKNHLIQGVPILVANNQWTGKPDQCSQPSHSWWECKQVQRQVFLALNHVLFLSPPGVKSEILTTGRPLILANRNRCLYTQTKQN